MPHAEATTLLAQATRELERCHTALVQGKRVDIEPCSNYIAELCALLATLPREEAVQYEEALLHMDQALRAMQHTMSERRDALQAQMNGLSRQQEAQTAYRKAGGAQGPSGTKEAEETEPSGNA